MTQDVLTLLRQKFPKQKYFLTELAKMHNCHVDTIKYQLRKHDIPIFRLTNSPYIFQEEVIFWFMKENNIDGDSQKIKDLEKIIQGLVGKRV